jgi:CMP-2-keto-3-deoxyoctulosonic acid synthetase
VPSSFIDNRIIDAVCDVLEAQAHTVDALAQALEAAEVLNNEDMVKALGISNGGRRMAAHLREECDA